MDLEILHTYHQACLQHYFVGAKTTNLGFQASLSDAPQKFFFEQCGQNATRTTCTLINRHLGLTIRHFL
jgi:hypothetical protein